MFMSAESKNLLAQWEGFEREVYKDSAGLDTIGVGHLLTSSEKDSGYININGDQVPYADGLSDEQIIDLLSQDLTRFEEAVTDSVAVELKQNQFDALVSFSFNIGTGNFKSSTLLRILNEGNFDGVPDQLRRWNKAGGRVVQGLVNRRENEINLWNG